MDESPEENIFRADGLARQRTTGLVYAVLCACGLGVWSVCFAWPMVEPNAKFQTRTTWFGSETLGWVFVVGGMVLLLYGVIGYLVQAARLTAEIRALRAGAAAFPHARVHSR